MTINNNKLTKLSSQLPSQLPSLASWQPLVQGRPHHCRAMLFALPLLILMLMLHTVTAYAADEPKPVEREYVTHPPAPAYQSQAGVDAASAGCLTCHTATDEYSMHQSPGVNLGCADCHGGDATINKPMDAKRGDMAYMQTLEQAHVLPRYPDVWHWPDSANPERSYTILNKEAPEYIRFVNPSDYRIARESCGSCHMEIIKAAERSLMANAAMFWGGAAYNNGILPYKHYALGETYTRTGEAAMVLGPPRDDYSPELTIEHGVVEKLLPMPSWETLKPADVFRVFEDGGRNITNLFPETGIPSNLGQQQRQEEPGRPDIRQSNRGPGTGARIAVPVLNIHKTRLNDPLMWFLGTNDQPGDYRSSGCASCHVVYSNDRDPKHSAGYAQFGHSGTSQTIDPTISKTDSGHPLQHTFTRSIPTSQCMICHMHQPNMFMNTYLGYTMWDYESDAPKMWPKDTQTLDLETEREVLDRNPEGAVVRGKWADLDFLKSVWERNDEMEDTQFADYHGHGWNFRAIFKRDRDGNLLDEEGDIVDNADPKKFDKAVHMSSIHADVGMHCVDCHYDQDSHGDGHLYTEVAAAVEIDCRDCHGTPDNYPTLLTSGPAAGQYGKDLSLIRNPDGQKRFEWRGEGDQRTLIQRSLVTPGLEWEVSLVKDSIQAGHPEYNPEAAQAKLMSRDTDTLAYGNDVSPEQRAHGDMSGEDGEMECYTCHTSWTTSCGGCHLPIEANWKTERHHYEGGTTRNWASYNPQVARDQLFMLGKHGDVAGNTVAPLRSTSALVLSSTNANREKIYVQQPPVAASGYSSQAFNPHFPHTVRREETKRCDDCHASSTNDNNAIMASLMGLGGNYFNFIGYHAWVGGTDEINAIQVTEWDEPQAVIGSYLHRFAYPDRYATHKEAQQELTTAHSHSTSGEARCVQLRGEYLFVAEGHGGMRVYDAANVANKGFSQRIVTAPFSPLGQDTHINTANATCVAVATTQPVAPERNQGELMRDINREQPFHPIYNYALITDAEEGLILTDINTLSDGNFRNNFLERQLTYNPDGLLNGARHITIAGHIVYVIANEGVVVLDLDNPLDPQVLKLLPVNDGRETAVQFRYLFVTDADGVKVFNVTQPENAFYTGSTLNIADARGIQLVRTWGYVAAGSEGLVILDITNPEQLSIAKTFNPSGQFLDATDVQIGATNASLFAYVADGIGGLKVVQLIAPDTQPNFYGFSPEPQPYLVAHYPTSSPALSVSEGLNRDRAVDETGHQIAVFGRLGARPFNLTEMRELYLNDAGDLWTVPSQQSPSQ